MNRTGFLTDEWYSSRPLEIPDGHYMIVRTWTPATHSCLCP